MPVIRPINIKQIFERAAGRKISDEYLHRGKAPIALGPSKPIASNLDSK